MIKFDRCAEIDVELLQQLDLYPVPTRPKRWKGKAQAVTTFKSSIMALGLELQSGRCAWCTLPVGEEGRRTAHRDHIAPKAEHPQWTFLPKNIVIACEFCNGFAVKGEIDTVEVSSETYESCTFYVVHPYLDNPADHLAFACADDEAKIVITCLSSKGIWTATNLKLDTPSATVARAKEYVFQRRTAELLAAHAELLRNAVDGLGSGS